MSTCTLPEHLHPAYNWTDSAGEIDELRTRTGDRLAEYCRDSAANASEHDEVLVRHIEANRAD